MKQISYITILLLSLLNINAAYSAEELTLGVHPYKSVKKLQTYYQPLVDLLSKELKIKVTLSIAKDYETHIKRIGRDKLDIAYMGPASYVAMVNKFGTKPLLARQMIKGKPTFKGNIVIRADSNIKTYSDLENKRFAFGDPNSTMSHLLPRYMLIENGITKEKLKNMSFLGSHDNVAISVLTGEFDAGAVKEAVYQKFKKKGIASLAETPELSEHLFVASNKVSQKIVEKVRHALLNLHNSEEGMKVLKGIKKKMTGMSSVRDEDYDNLREILGLLKEKNIIK